MTPYEVFLGVFAKADDPSSGGRQMPAHWGSRRLSIISGSSPIATQVPHAAGIAFAARYRGEDTVVGCWFGDGATSEGDWHEGLNFSGIHRLPVIFVCENNQYAISVPQSKQMAIKDVASRAEGYGFPGVVVDGNDVLACYGAMKTAHERARARFTSDVPAALAEKQAAEPGVWDDVVLVPPTEGIERRGVIELGGLSLELHALPGHTLDCIVGFVPERGLLLAGDTVETPFPVVPADSLLAGWISELERWASDDRVRTVVPAHGRIGGREVLVDTVAYLGAILRGQPIEPQGVLTPFYRQTHLANIRWAGRPS